MIPFWKTAIVIVRLNQSKSVQENPVTQLKVIIFFKRRISQYVVIRYHCIKFIVRLKMCNILYFSNLLFERNKLPGSWLPFAIDWVEWFWHIFYSFGHRDRIALYMEVSYSFCGTNSLHYQTIQLLWKNISRIVKHYPAQITNTKRHILEILMLKNCLSFVYWWVYCLLVRAFNMFVILLLFSCCHLYELSDKLFMLCM